MIGKKVLSQTMPTVYNGDNKMRSTTTTVNPTAMHLIGAPVDSFNSHINTHKLYHPNHHHHHHPSHHSHHSHSQQQPLSGSLISPSLNSTPVANTSTNNNGAGSSVGISGVIAANSGIGVVGSLGSTGLKPINYFSLHNLNKNNNNHHGSSQNQTNNSNNYATYHVGGNLRQNMGSAVTANLSHTLNHRTNTINNSIGFLNTNNNNNNNNIPPKSTSTSSSSSHHHHHHHNHNHHNNNNHPPLPVPPHNLITHYRNRHINSSGSNTNSSNNFTSGSSGGDITVTNSYNSFNSSFLTNTGGASSSGGGGGVPIPKKPTTAVEPFSSSSSRNISTAVAPVVAAVINAGGIRKTVGFSAGSVSNLAEAAASINNHYNLNFKKKSHKQRLSSNNLFESASGNINNNKNSSLSIEDSLFQQAQRKRNIQK